MKTFVALCAALTLSACSLFPPAFSNEVNAELTAARYQTIRISAACGTPAVVDEVKILATQVQELEVLTKTSKLHQDVVPIVDQVHAFKPEGGELYCQEKFRIIGEELTGIIKYMGERL